MTYVAVLAAVDAVAMAGATLLARAWWLGPGPAELHIRSVRLPYDLLPLATVPTWLVILALAGAYDLGPFGSTQGLWTRIVRAGAQLLAVVAVTYYVLHLQLLGRGVLVAVVPLAVGFTLLGRAAVGAVVRRARHQGRARRTALVAGSRRGIEAVVLQLADHQAAGITPIDVLVVGEDPAPATNGNGNGAAGNGAPGAPAAGGPPAGNGAATDSGATGNGATDSGATGNGATDSGATGNGATASGATGNGATDSGATGNGAEPDAAAEAGPADGGGPSTTTPVGPAGNGGAAGNGAPRRGGLPVATGDPVRAVIAALARSGAEALIVTGDLAKGQLRDIAWQLQGTGVELLVVAAAPGDLEGLRPQVRPVAGLPLLYVD
jgi:hypothetical protein